MSGKSEYILVIVSAAIIQMLAAVSVSDVQAIVSMLCQVVVAWATCYKIYDSIRRRRENKG